MMGEDTLKLNVAKVTRLGFRNANACIMPLSIDCGSHPTINNGVVAGDTFYGGSPAVYCNNGYTQTGTATCGADNNWGTDVQCVPVGEFNVR